MNCSTLSKIATIFFCGGFGLATGLAQVIEPEAAPRQPILPRAEKAATWSVAYKYTGNEPTKPTVNGVPGEAAASQKPVERIASTLTEKNGKVYHQLTIYTSGAKKENWSVDGEQLCKNVHSEKYVIVNMVDPLAVDFTQNDFPELTWLGTDNFVGVTGQDKKGFTFEVENIRRRPTAFEREENRVVESAFSMQASAKGKPTEQQKAAAKSQFEDYLQAKFGRTVSIAFLDLKTQLPISYNDGFVTRTYSFTDKAGPATAPPEVMKEILYWKAHDNATTVRPSTR